MGLVTGSTAHDTKAHVLFKAYGTVLCNKFYGNGTLPFPAAVGIVTYHFPAFPGGIGRVIGKPVVVGFTKNVNAGFIVVKVIKIGDKGNYGHVAVVLLKTDKVAGMGNRCGRAVR